MSRGIARRSPALVVACVALIAALSGTVYAAAKINGHSIKRKSLPGNRLVPRSVAGNRLVPRSVPGNRLAPGSVAGNRLIPGSVPGNRLAPGSVPADRLEPGTIPGASLAPSSITGAEIDVATLGQVPSAVHADNADSAHDAETALNAVNAVTATRVNGYEAGCRAGTALFAGACWQIAPSDTALKAPQAAASCATQGGSLPGALELVAYAQQPGAALASEEWSSDLTNISDKDVYAVITVMSTSEVNFASATASKKFRCVMPLLS